MIYIVRKHNRWAIEAGSVQLGTYSTRTEAIQAAALAVSSLAQKGHRPQVLAQVECPSTWEKIVLPDDLSAAVYGVNS